MALRTPPSWLQNGSHPAENDRLTMQALVSSTGVIGSSSLQITAQGSPNMTVNAAAGWGSILSSTANAGVYIFYNDASTTLTISTADATNPRIDRVVVTVNDTYYSGSLNNVTFTVIAGTPAGSPTAPATPSNSISLATIAVAANTTTITSGNITDTRSLASSSLSSGVYLPLAGGSLTGNLTTVAGTTTVAPITMTTASSLTSPLVPSAIEYDGKVQYFNPSASATLTTNGGRALTPNTHFYALNADRASTATTPGEAAFGVRLTVAANTAYEFEAVMFYQVVNSAGSGTLNLGHGGTATINSIAYQIDYASASSSLNASASWNSIGVNTAGAATLATVNSASPGVSVFTKVIIKGMVRFGAAGTFAPQSQVTSNTTATLLANSYVKMTPLGINNIQPVAGAWA